MVAGNDSHGLGGEVQQDVLHVRIVEIFRPRDAHGDRYDVDVGGLLPFFDVFSFWCFFAGALLLLVLFEVPISNQYFDYILEMNEIIGVMPVAFVEPTIFALVGSRLGRCLSKKVHPGLLKFKIGAFKKNMFP